MKLNKSKLIQRWKELNLDQYMKDGSFRMTRAAHTRAVAYLEHCHSGVLTSRAYAAGIYLGILSGGEGLNMLKKLESLQCREKDSEMYGCSRWYFEETQIADTNGAFFITMPLLQLCTFSPESIPQAHWETLLHLFSCSIRWFQRECRRPQNHYSNKILSDAAALCALSVLTKDKEAQETAISFCRQWSEYTLTRGWGWGENISPYYAEVIMDALLMIVINLYRIDRETAGQMSRFYRQIAEYAGFHGGFTYVPAIRSYNFFGSDRHVNEESGIPHIAGYKTGVDKDLLLRVEQDDNPENLFGYVLAYMIYEDRLSRKEGEEWILQCKKLLSVNRQVDKAVRMEPVFDQAVAYTWKGEHCRLGSINHYPVIPGCYQHPTWGLGWQSMPIAFLVYGAQMAYARFRVEDGESLRTHPAYDHHSAYLSPSLFREPYLPAVRTNSAQEKNVLIALRTIENVNNRVLTIADEWVLHRFSHRMEEYGDWKCLIYPDCCVAILPLGGFGQERETIRDRSCCVVWDNDTLLLRKKMYQGETVQNLFCERLECGWIVIMLENTTDMEDIREILDTYSIQDDYEDDYLVPRVFTSKIRRVKVCQNQQPICELVFDLYQGIRA